ncbi:thioredoxin-dependent thiol peroxidase [bacterium]|nr:thioredoxin-dependent thiol peroxidase [bacterium]
MLKVGQKAPDFRLSDTNGNEIVLSSFIGRKVVLFFYPKDDTPGCTKEACSFNAGIKKFEKQKIAVFGISPDDMKSHRKFTEKFDLSFPLLSDIGHKVAEKYGAWGKKKLYGREYEGVIRSTFLIDEKGNIEYIFDKVKVDIHADEVLEVIKMINPN